MAAPIRRDFLHKVAIQRSPQGLFGVICFTGTAYLSLQVFAPSALLCCMRRATSSPSSSKSPRLQSARPSPADAARSGVAASVHCGGTEQIRPSAKRSSQRLPDRLPRLATHTPPCPEYGWKGWVTVTRCGEAGDTPAFLTEVQDSGARPFSLALCGRRDGATDIGPTRDAVGRDRLEAPELGRTAGTRGVTFLP
jgi:hypothetical protein